MMKIAKYYCYASLLAVTGCMGAYNLFAGGGRLIDPSKEQYRVIAAYQSSPSSDLVYQLVEIEDQLAVLEVSESQKSYMLVETHWDDAKGDHFAAWIKGRGDHAFAKEFVIPRDREKPASMYVYPYGQYDVLEMNGVLRPVPKRYGQVEPIELLQSEPKTQAN